METLQALCFYFFVGNLPVKEFRKPVYISPNYDRNLRVFVLLLGHSVETTDTHAHTGLTVLFSGTTQVSQYQKAKPTWILLKQETASGSGISWAICKSAPRSGQTTTPAPHHSVFLQAGCPSCRPTNSVKAPKQLAVGNICYGSGEERD